MTEQKPLSKSNYLAGLQCKKLLWFNIHDRSLAAPVDEDTQRIFDIGHRIGELATRRFPGGELIDEPYYDVEGTIAHTQKAVEDGIPAIFEATAVAGRLLSKADILARVENTDNEWDMYEVKSSTKVKDVHIPDMALQKHCFELAGYTIRKCFLVHVSTAYVRQGEIDPQQLLQAEEITERVAEHLPGIESRVKELHEVMDSSTRPDIEAGPQCSDPYDCPYWDECNDAWEPYTVYDLSYGANATSELEKQGIYYLKDVPEDFPLTDRQKMHVQAVKTDKPVYDTEKIRAFIDSLEYPLYHFDFETTGCAIPLFDNTRPYIQFPFQYSLHIQKEPNGKCDHRYFLNKDRTDPQKALAEQMIHHLGKEGSIIAWNMSFEQGHINGLAELFPEYSEQLRNLVPRFRDLMIPFRTSYAHKDFHGSASLKYVLPVLVPKLSYEELEEIQDGGTAFLRAQKWYSGDMPEEEWEKNYNNLLKYCELDTLAMVEILRKLYEVVEDIKGNNQTNIR
ncbi:MAG: DUF2779 domain-containing protein [Fibrobacteria bacterium]|nr:DUF2779 domain-containing protein [Fibrobacteria bacterium]